MVLNEKCSVSVGVKVLLGVLIARENVKVVAVDLHIASNGQVGRSNELQVLVNILVLASLKELSISDARVLLARLKDRDGIIREIE